MKHGETTDYPDLFAEVRLSEYKRLYEDRLEEILALRRSNGRLRNENQRLREQLKTLARGV